MADIPVAVPARRPDRPEVFLVDPAVRRRRREQIVVRVSQAVLCIVVLGLWELTSGGLFDDFWISTPSQIFLALVRLFSGGQLMEALGITMLEVFVGFLFGALIGCVLGLVLGINPLVARVLDPFLLGLYALPRIALLPLFILWFGIGLEMKVVFTALLVFFPIFMNTLSGVRDVDRDLIDVLRVMGARPMETVRKVYIPSALAWVFAGLRISVPFALIGAVVAEMFSSNRGLGYLISLSANQFDTAGLFAALLVTTLVGLILDALVRRIEKYLLRWQPA